MRMGLSALFPARIRCLLLLCLFAGAGAFVFSQQGSDEVTPEVQKLYAEARAAKQRGDNAAAIDKYQAMIKLAPHLAAAYNNLGMLYFDAHDYTRAAKILEHGLQIDPSMPGAKAMLGM